jgi:hypothetical protein
VTGIKSGVEYLRGEKDNSRAAETRKDQGTRKLMHEIGGSNDSPTSYTSKVVSMSSFKRDSRNIQNTDYAYRNSSTRGVYLL